MKIIRLFLEVRYYIILAVIFTVIIVFPFDEYKSAATALFFWMLFLGYLIQMVVNKISINDVFKQGLIAFFLGSLMGSVGLMDLAELVFKLSFLLFFTGIIGALVKYHKIK